MVLRAREIETETDGWSERGERACQSSLTILQTHEGIYTTRRALDMVWFGSVLGQRADVASQEPRRENV